MDPTAARNICVDRARIILTHQDEGDEDPHTILDEAYELAQAFTDLDEWLLNGGFLPGSWERHEALQAENAELKKKLEAAEGRWSNFVKEASANAAALEDES